VLSETIPNRNSSPQQSSSHSEMPKIKKSGTSKR